MIDFSHFHRLAYPDKSKFWQFYVSSCNTDIIPLVYGSIGLVSIVFTFECRMCCTFLKKVHKTSVEVTQRLLQGNGIHRF